MAAGSDLVFERRGQGACFVKKMIGVDPASSLALSITTSPGTYALLLGSGVSRAAGIPTG